MALASMNGDTGHWGTMVPNGSKGVINNKYIAATVINSVRHQ